MTMLLLYSVLDVQLFPDLKKKYYIVTVHQSFSRLSFRPFLIRRLTDEKSAGISSFNRLRKKYSPFNGSSTSIEPKRLLL